MRKSKDSVFGLSNPIEKARLAGAVVEERFPIPIVELDRGGVRSAADLEHHEEAHTGSDHCTEKHFQHDELREEELLTDVGGLVHVASFEQVAEDEPSRH